MRWPWVEVADHTLVLRARKLTWSREFCDNLVGGALLLVSEGGDPGVPVWEITPQITHSRAHGFFPQHYTT